MISMVELDHLKYEHVLNSFFFYQADRHTDFIFVCVREVAVTDTVAFQIKGVCPTLYRSRSGRIPLDRNRDCVPKI